MEKQKDEDSPMDISNITETKDHINECVDSGRDCKQTTPHLQPHNVASDIQYIAKQCKKPLVTFENGLLSDEDERSDEGMVKTKKTNKSVFYDEDSDNGVEDRLCSGSDKGMRKTKKRIKKSVFGDEDSDDGVEDVLRFKRMVKPNKKTKKSGFGDQDSDDGVEDRMLSESDNGMEKTKKKTKKNVFGDEDSDDGVEDVLRSKSDNGLVKTGEKTKKSGFGDEDSDDGVEDSIRSESDNGVGKTKKKTKTIVFGDEDSDDGVEDVLRSKSGMVKTDKKTKKGGFGDEDSDDGVEDSIRSESDNDKIETIKHLKDPGSNGDDSVVNGSGSSSDSDSSDDDGPPVRIFRSTDPTQRNAEATVSDEERDDLSKYSRARRSKQPNSNHLDIKSETQRIIRESSVNLPYHVPEPKKLSEFMECPNLDFICKKSGARKKLQSVENVKMSYCDDANQQVCDDLLSLTRSNERSSLVSPIPCTGQKTDNLSNETVNTVPETVGVVLKDERNSVLEERPKVVYVPPAPRKRKSLRERTLALLSARGVSLPTVCLSKPCKIAKPTTEFVELRNDDVDVSDPHVEGFKQRVVKHAVKNETHATNPPDGDDEDTVVKTRTDKPVETYKEVRKKLAEKMKEKRQQERLKREEFHRLDNEEVEGEDDEEEEEDFMTDESDHDGDDEVDRDDSDVTKPTIDDDGGGGGGDYPYDDVVQDDDYDAGDDVRLSDGEQGSNGSVTSKASAITARSEVSSHLMKSEGSILLFDDSLKKSSSFKEESVDHQSSCSFNNPSIPLNQPDPSSLSSIHRPELNDDSCIFSERSFNTSLNESQHRSDLSQSQFFDSEGFIKEPSSKSRKSNPLLILDAEDDNANDCNMSQLLELCSGKFQESSLSLGESKEAEDVNDDSLGFHFHQDESCRGGTNAHGVHTPHKGDRTENVGESEEEGDDNMVIIRRKKPAPSSPHHLCDLDNDHVTNREDRKIFKFFDEEAELSGDDVGSDDDDDGGDNQDEYELEEIDEDLPEEEEIQRQVNKVHLKQLLDEDKRDIEMLQEAFAEQDPILNRKRRFKWKDMDDNVMFADVNDDDVNDDDVVLVDEEESRWRKFRLERDEFLDSIPDDDDVMESESQVLKLGKVVMENSKSRTYSDAEKVKTPSISRNSSFTLNSKLATPQSFLSRDSHVLAKYAKFRDLKTTKGAVNSDKMIFKVKSPTKSAKRVSSRCAVESISKRPRSLTSLSQPQPYDVVDDGNSNSVFDML